MTSASTTRSADVARPTTSHRVRWCVETVEHYEAILEIPEGDLEPYDEDFDVEQLADLEDGATATSIEVIERYTTRTGLRQHFEPRWTPTDGSPLNA